MFSRWFTMLASTLLLVILAAGCKNSPTPSVVALTLTPDAVTLVPGEVQEFVASVTGAADTGVTWSVTGGTIVGSGNAVTYTAPAVVGGYVLTATSSADASKSATAVISVVGGDEVVVVVSPASVTLVPGEVQEFVATVTGAVDTSVTWSVTGGTLVGSGSAVTYTAPVAEGGYVLTVTSVADPSKSATASISVVAEPDLLWARQLGTSSVDLVNSVAVDGSDHVLIAGRTSGSLFAPNQGSYDAFVAKLAPDGLTVWEHQHGTSEHDEIMAVAVDASDHVLIAGRTWGSLFGPYHGGADAFVAKLEPDGSLVWGYQHGTSAWDEIISVAVDGSNNVLIAGRTSGSLFAPHQGLSDAFVAKLAPDGSPLWGYQHGTSVYDDVTAVAVDASNHVLIAGRTWGSLFGPNHGGWDPFVAKLAPDGSPVWGYQHGTSADDAINAIAVDGGNHLLISGWTSGGLFGPNHGGGDAFVAKLAPDGLPVWGYQHGTSEHDEITAVAVDGSNNVLIAGHTAGSLFGLHQGTWDVFVAKLAP